MNSIILGNDFPFLLLSYFNLNKAMSWIKIRRALGNQLVSLHMLQIFFKNKNKINKKNIYTPISSIKI
jgi:hypothetical protein